MWARAASWCGIAKISSSITTSWPSASTACGISSQSMGSGSNSRSGTPQARKNTRPSRRTTTGIAMGPSSPTASTLGTPSNPYVPSSPNHRPLDRWTHADRQVKHPDHPHRHQERPRRKQASQQGGGRVIRQLAPNTLPRMQCQEWGVSGRCLHTDHSDDEVKIHRWEIEGGGRR